MPTTNQHPLKLTANGRLMNLADWNEGIAAQLADTEGLVLTPAHWDIIRIMRHYYESYHISPIKKLLKKEIGAQLGQEKTTDAYLDHLFPHGVLLQGTKMAGLPIPLLDAEIENLHTTEKLPAARSVPAASHFVDTFDFEGKTYHVHAKGNLVDMDAWNERLAEFMADKEGLPLTREHWEVLHFLRKFYFSYGVAPMVRLLMTHMQQELGREKSSRQYLYRLFPGGPARQGSRIAGLPEPQGCIDD